MTGPAPSVTVNAAPNIEYWIFANVPPQNCDVNLDSTGNSGAVLGAGHQIVPLRNPPAKVTQGGRSYGYAGTFFTDSGGDIQVECRDGLVLVEAASPSWLSPSTVAIATLVVLTLLAEAGIALRRRRPSRR